MRRWLIKLFGGYDSISGLIESYSPETRNILLTEAVKHLYNSITADDILQEVDDKWLVGGKPISEGEKKLLIAEANQLVNSFLWKVLQTDIKWKSNEIMFLKSQTENDLIAGKMWLFTLDVINTRLDSLKSESGKFHKRLNADAYRGLKPDRKS